MKLIEFVVELQGNKEVSLNGVHISKGEPRVEEKILVNQVGLEQQWQVLSMARKMLGVLEHTYQKSRVKRGEISMADYDTTMRRRKTTSGSKGVPGTSIKKLG